MRLLRASDGEKLSNDGGQMEIMTVRIFFLKDWFVELGRDGGREKIVLSFGLLLLRERF